MGEEAFARERHGTIEDFHCTRDERTASSVSDLSRSKSILVNVPHVARPKIRNVEMGTPSRRANYARQT